MECKYCQSAKVVKNGKTNGTQRLLCKDCGHKFFEGSNFPRMRTKSRIIVRPHQSLKGKTPAQASGLNIKNNWHLIVKEATKHPVLASNEKRTKLLEVVQK